MFAQGGPPYYTNDPGTPGNLNWEINLGYMPFLYSDQSVSHTPDVDINFGIGDRIQLTYENAWLRVQSPSSPAKYGMGQSNPGVKWRFYDKGESGLNISVFPRLFLNDPNDAVRRGITPASESFLLPIEFSRRIGPVDVNYEMGYQFVHKGPDGGFLGLVVGRDVTQSWNSTWSSTTNTRFIRRRTSPRWILAPVINSIVRSSFSSWQDEVLKPQAAVNPISSAISVSNFCCLQGPTRRIYRNVREEIDTGLVCRLRAQT
ncbi:MAG: hypothetical protein WBM24_17315 [Candidatus Sulfotelmatobacter sp.]